MQARDMGDTLIARINNKLYYTVKADGSYQVTDDSVVFHPYNPLDTTGDIYLRYVAEINELLKHLRHGDTINNYFMADMKFSFTDLTDLSPAKQKKSPRLDDKSRILLKHVKAQKINAKEKLSEKRLSALYRKRTENDVPFSKPIVFNNCVFGPIIADTSSNMYEDDAGKKSRHEFLEDVIMINCTFTAGMEISDCDFNKDFELAGQLLSPSPSLIDNCNFLGICYLYSSPELGNWQSYFNFSHCSFANPFIFTATNSDRAHFTLERCNMHDIFSFGRSVPDYAFKKFRLTYSDRHFFYRLDQYADWYSDFLRSKYGDEPESDNDTIEDFAPNDRIVYNVLVKNSRIKVLDLANANLFNCSFENLVIEQAADVTDCNFSYSDGYKGKLALEDLSFPRNDAVLYAGYKTFSPEAMKLGIYLEKIKIHPYVHNYFDSTTDFLEDNSNFYNSIKDYCAAKFTNGETVTALKARYEHEKSDWEREYYGAHLRHSAGVGDFFSSLIHWSLGWFLEATVSTGYKGETKFFLWVVILIIAFSIIYYFRHHDAVIDYLNSMYNKSESDLAHYSTMKVYKSFNGIRDYMRCLWFSCLVFVDPRLPITFFNLRVGLFGLVLAEWLCGLTAILLFLVFLASNYPFIHSLIGI